MGFTKYIFIATQIFFAFCITGCGRGENTVSIDLDKHLPEWVKVESYSWVSDESPLGYDCLFVIANVTVDDRMANSTVIQTQTILDEWNANVENGRGNSINHLFSNIPWAATKLKFIALNNLSAGDFWIALSGTVSHKHRHHFAKSIEAADDCTPPPHSFSNNSLYFNSLLNRKADYVIFRLSFPPYKLIIIDDGQMFYFDS